MSSTIDVRARPQVLDPFYGGSAERNARIAWVNRRVGSRQPDHFESVLTLERFLAVADDAEIDRSVVIGRQVPVAFIRNDRVAKVVGDNERLIGIGAVDPSNPQTGGVLGAVEETRRCIERIGLSGMNVDPGFGVDPMLPGDRRLYPVYAACEGLDVPVFIMSGPLSGPTLEYTLPRYFATVASDFPDLDIVVSHGAYPFVSEAIGAAFRHERLHLSPDIYTFMPDAGGYVEALSGFLSDQFLFGTGYPFRSMEQTAAQYRELPISDDVAAAIFGTNAARLLLNQVA